MAAVVFGDVAGIERLADVVQAVLAGRLGKKVERVAVHVSRARGGSGLFRVVRR